MNELITTTYGELNGESQSLVNARDLHEFLGVGKDFSNWIKKRVDQYNFVEGEDFSPNQAKTSNWLGGRPKTEYLISLDMAKELCMLENNEQGRKARRYFIEMEKQARLDIPTYLRRGPDNLASPAEHEIAVLRMVVLDSKPLWAKLKRYYDAGLSQTEMCKLVERSGSTVREHLRHMTLAGLIDYEANPKLSAAGKKSIAKRLEVQHAE